MKSLSITDFNLFTTILLCIFYESFFNADKEKTIQVFKNDVKYILFSSNPPALFYLMNNNEE